MTFDLRDTLAMVITHTMSHRLIRMKKKKVQTEQKLNND